MLCATHYRQLDQPQRGVLHSGSFGWRTTSSQIHIAHLKRNNPYSMESAETHDHRRRFGPGFGGRQKIPNFGGTGKRNLRLSLCL